MSPRVQMLIALKASCKQYASIVNSLGNIFKCSFRPSITPSKHTHTHTPEQCAEKEGVAEQEMEHVVFIHAV